MEQPNNKLPKDAAQIVFWFKGLPQPTGFLVLRDAAEQLVKDFQGGAEHLTFLSYPDGRGVRSESTFRSADLRGVTIEYPTIQLALVN